jgi:hypothetical protein
MAPSKGYARTVANSGPSSERMIVDLARLKRNRVDALNYYGYWKLLDGLLDAAFRGTNRAYALGNTPEQRFMGRWSDGTPVAELVVGDPTR